MRVAGPAAAPPLYDGVIVVEPYVWLDPPPGQPGGALPTSTTVAVEGGRNRLVALTTDEEPPQAQLLATSGALILANGATSLSVSITPVEPAQPVPTGYVDGNVYRFAVVDQLGRPATAAASAAVTIFLRSANTADLDATIERFDGTTWAPIETTSEGNAGFLAIVTAFGDFAVVGHGANPFGSAVPGATVAPGTSPIRATTAPATTGPSTGPVPSVDALPLSVVAAAGVGLFILVVAVTLVVRRRRRGADR